MILNLEDCKSYDAKIRKWHDWFAWYPVYVGPNKFAWFQTIERRVYCNHSYSNHNCCCVYRLRGSNAL